MTTTPQTQKALVIYDFPSAFKPTKAGSIAARTDGAAEAPGASSSGGDGPHGWDEALFDRNKTTFDDLGPRFLEVVLELISLVAMWMGELEQLARPRPASWAQSVAV